MNGYYEDGAPNKFVVNDIDLGCPLHFHNNVEIAYFLSGTHTIKVNNTEIVCTENDVFFGNPFDIHEYSHKNNGEHLLLTVRPNQFLTCFPNGKCPYFQNFLNDKAYNTSILPVLQTIRAEQHNMNELEKQGYINIIIGKLIKHYKVLDSADKQLDSFIDVITYINQHYKENITRDSLAKFFNYSPNYFSHQFKKIFNIGLTEYINSIRFSRAYQEITYGNKTTLSHCDIILSHGFQNPQSYYRIHRKQKNLYLL